MTHPNIIDYVTSFLEGDTLHIITAFCDGGDLSQLIKDKKEKHEHFTEDEIMDIFVQLAMAVDFIHAHKIMHRDLKSGNIFLTQKGVVKLGDFGIAKVLDSNSRHAQTVVGTPFYMSPEVCENKPYDFKSDVWAMGCILYEMCTLEHAFEASNLLGLVVKIVTDPVGPIPDMYSDDLKTLVKLLLQKNPADRPSLKKIFTLPFVRTRLERLAVSRALPQLDDTGTSMDGVSPRHRRDSSLLLSSAPEPDEHTTVAKARHRRESSLLASKPHELNRATSQDMNTNSDSATMASSGEGSSLMRRSSSVMGFLSQEGEARSLPRTPGSQTRLDVLATPKKPAGSKHSRSRSSIQFDHNIPPILLDEFASTPAAAAEMYLRTSAKTSPVASDTDLAPSVLSRSRGHSRTDSYLPSVGTSSASLLSLNDSGKKNSSRRSSLEGL